MPYTLLAFLSRKPDLSPSAFKDYYINHHLPMVREILGPLFPTVHKQHYPERVVPSSYSSASATVDFDVMLTLEFPDEEAFRKHLEVLERPDIAARVAADEQRFLDRGRTVAVKLGSVVEMTAA